MRHTLLAPGQFRGPAGAGYQDSCRMLRRVTQPTFIVGLLAKIIKTMNQHDKFSAKVFYQLLTGLIILLIPLTSKAQLFEDVELFPQTNIIKGKYYSGSGGCGYWSLDYVDSIGRIVIKESYHKKQLMLKPEQKSFYLGGPGSDDEYYKYTFDPNGRIKKFYRIIEGKKFKIAVYKYF